MKILRIDCTSEDIRITKEKKKLFGGKVEKTEIVTLNEIAMVGKEVFQGILNSTTIFMKDGSEIFIAREYMQNDTVLDGVVDFLISNKEKYGYKAKIIDIESLEEQEI